MAYPKCFPTRPRVRRWCGLPCSGWLVAALARTAVASLVANAFSTLVGAIGCVTTGTTCVAFIADAAGSAGSIENLIEHFSSEEGRGHPGNPGEAAALSGGLRGHPGGGGGGGGRYNYVFGSEPGGGGALLIASTLSIDIRAGASVLANGGVGGASWGYGSGGAIRLVAPDVRGAGALHVSGGGLGGDGRIRIDLVRRDNLNLTFNPGTPGTLVIGSLMTIFPPVSSQLDIVAVGTERFTPGQQHTVFVNIPAGANPNQQVEVQARDFNRSIPITLALIPESGPPAYFQTTLDNVAANPVSRKITVPFPANVLVRDMAWTR